MFTLNKRNSEYYTVDLSNFRTIGEIYKQIDGFYVFSFTNKHVSGCFDEPFFTFVAKQLRRLNKPI